MWQRPAHSTKSSSGYWRYESEESAAIWAVRIQARLGTSEMFTMIQYISEKHQTKIFSSI
jgi:hypothetical protein